MKRFSMFVFTLTVILIAAAMPVLVVSAAGIAPAHALQVAEPVAPFDFDALLASFKNLTGIAMLIAALVNVLKTAGVAKDGQANSWSAGLNLLALVGLFIAQLTGYANLVPSFNAQAGEFSNVIGVAFAFFWQLYASRKTNDMALAGLPAIGKSYSERNAGETVSTIEAVSE